MMDIWQLRVQDNHHETVLLLVNFMLQVILVYLLLIVFIAVCYFYVASFPCILAPCRRHVR